MTIIAITEVYDCEYICNEAQPPIPGNPSDRCVAIAGVIGDSDLTVMTFCIPIRPGVGVRSNGNWTAENTLDIMNSVVDIQFAEFQRGDGLVLLREQSASATTGFKSRIDYVWKDGPPYNPVSTVPIIGEASYAKVVQISSPDDQVNIHQVMGIIVQPPFPQTVTNQYAILYAKVSASITRNAPTVTDDITGINSGFEETITYEEFCMCGPLLGKRAWAATKCEYGIWDEAALGHIVWTGPEDATVLPAGIFSIFLSQP